MRIAIIGAGGVGGYFGGKLANGGADVIAVARIRDGIVITEETHASEKRNPRRTHFIPDVCRDLGGPCINFLGLMRREGWKF